MRRLEPIEEEHIEHELEKCLSLIRYDNKKKSTSTQARFQQPSLTHSNLPFKCSDLYKSNPSLESTTLKFPSMRVTDLPTSKMVILPQVIDNNEETKLLAFKTEVVQLTKEYIEQNCHLNGNTS